MKNLNEVIKKRHTTKRYIDGPDLTKEQIENIIDAAYLAPSATNFQDSQIVIITNKSKKEEYAEFFEESNKINILKAKALIIFIGTPFKVLLSDNYKRIYDTIKDFAAKDALDETAKGVINYYTKVSKYTDTIDITSSSIQLAFVLLQATDIGFETTPMMGFNTSKLEEFMIKEKTMVQGQRINVTASLGYADKNDELNIKVAKRHRFAKENMYKIV
ncbi:nitroreductase family protein [Spiroplasma endosymbiont of Aspidapion aeneum]|uniref:nitroreductase family protein n=1 Tax=Spiroplasma endosymbiont of Aspidapion aeneum TaxID=3066276 RepID=UPI00313E1319